MIFNTKRKPWNNLDVISLVCHKPESIIDVIKGDFIEYQDIKYVVTGFFNGFIKVTACKGDL